MAAATYVVRCEYGRCIRRALYNYYGTDYCDEHYEIHDSAFYARYYKINHLRKDEGNDSFEKWFSLLQSEYKRMGYKMEGQKIFSRYLVVGYWYKGYDAKQVAKIYSEVQ